MTLRCPKCGSKRITYLSMTGSTAILATDQRYLCKDCGYQGAFFIDVPVDKSQKND